MREWSLKVFDDDPCIALSRIAVLWSTHACIGRWWDAQLGAHRSVFKEFGSYKGADHYHSLNRYEAFCKCACASQTARTVLLTSDGACLDVWNCGCATGSCKCADTVDGAAVGVWTCHPNDKHPLDQNQSWKLQACKTEHQSCMLILRS